MQLYIKLCILGCKLRWPAPFMRHFPPRIQFIYTSKSIFHTQWWLQKVKKIPLKILDATFVTILDPPLDRYQHTYITSLVAGLLVALVSYTELFLLLKAWCCTGLGLVRHTYTAGEVRVHHVTVLTVPALWTSTIVFSWKEVKKKF